MASTNFTIHTKSTLSATIIEDVIDTALESGIAYWASLAVWNADSTAALVAGKGSVTIHVPESDGDDREPEKQPAYTLDRKAIESGLMLLLSECPAQYANLHGDWDAETADVLVQYALFGELVFG